MRKVYFLLSLIIILASLNASAQNRYWVASGTGNWSDAANWSTTSGGAGGASVPGTSDVAIFNSSGPGNCSLDIAVNVGGITISSYAGTIDLSGFDLTTTGTSSFASGVISNSGTSASVILNSTGTSTFSGTTFNVSVTGSSSRLFLSGSTFNGSIDLTKSGANNDNGAGGNTFNSSVILSNNGSGSLLAAGINPDIFQSTLTVNINSTSDISLARVAANNQFNGDVTINYNSTGDVLFGAGDGTTALAATKTISVSSYGASGCGNLYLAHFTQNGTTAQNIILAGNNSARLTIGPGSTFNADLATSSPNLVLETSTFEGVTQITKTGSSESDLRGGNVFNGITTITNQGGDLMFGYIGSDPGDTFNADVTFNNTGGQRIRIAEESAGTVFNGTVYFNCTSSTDTNNRIQISRLSGADATFNGPVFFDNSGNRSDIHICYDAGTSATFNGPVTFTSNASNGAEYYIGNDGDVTFTNNIEFNNLSDDVIYMSHGTGSVSFGNGTISIGSGGFAQGQLRLQNFTQTGATAQSLTFTGTASLRLGPSSTFTGDVTFASPQLYLNGCTFNGTTILEKTGATTDNGAGNNIFNGITTLINSGSGNMVSGNTSTDIFNNDLTLTNSGSASINMAENTTGNIFQGNITVNCTSGNGIFFCNNAGATASLASGRTITVGSSGFTDGELRLQRFTQLGAKAQNLTFTGTASLKMGPSSEFNGAVTFVAPQIYLNGTTFNSTAYIEKNGAGDNNGSGGDVFNDVTTIVNSGSGSLDLANTNPNTYNAALTVTNNGTHRIQLGLSSAGNVYNGNTTFNHFGTNATNNNFIISRNSSSTSTFNGALTLNCNNNGSNSTGIIIGYDGSVNLNGNVTVTSTNGRGVLFGNSTGSVTLADGFTIKDNGAGTFTTGTLQLKSFTQLGTTAQSITLTDAGILSIGPSSAFHGNVNFVTPQVVLDGCTFNGTTYIEKNGASNNSSNGNNIFNGTTTLVNSGTGYFLSADVALDIFNGPLTLTNTGTSAIYMAHNVSGTVFNDNVFVNCTNGSGVFFGYGGGTSSLASGKTISVGGTGFTTGDLRLQRFTQSGSTAQSLTLTGTARLILGPSTEFDGDVNFVSPQVYMQGAVYNGTAYIEKNGATNNGSQGGNIFNSTTTMVNSGSGYLLSANSNADTFNGQLTLTNTGSSTIYMGYNSSGTTFNGNIIVNSTGGNGIYFGANTNGDATLASGRTITVGGLGFSSGELRLSRFAQLGSTAQSITLTGTGVIRLGPSSQFNGAVTFISPGVLLDGATFNSTASITKNGSGNNDSAGGNVFNGTTTLSTNSTNRWRLANGNGDTFNDDVTFVRSGSGVFYVAYNQTNFFAGDMILNSASGINFGGGGGVVQLTGSNAQSLNKTVGSSSPTIPLLTVAKSSNDFTLNTDLTIGNAATLTTGIINSTAANYLNFANDATVSGANDASYVNGPVRKTGNDAFTFPVGSDGYYRPIAISAPSNTTHHFTAQYFKSAQPYGGPTTWDPSFYSVSGCEYWILDRTNGTSNVSVTLSWDESACTPGYVSSLPDLRVARFNSGTGKWVNEGNGGTTGSSTSGTVVTAAAVTSFSPFTLASVDILNPLPVTFGSFWASDLGNAVELNWTTYSEENNDGFTIQRSETGFDFINIGQQKGAGTSKTQIHYRFIDGEPLPGISYYRLKQKDFDGKESFSNVVAVKRKGETIPFMAYPNPTGDEIVRFNQKTNIVVLNALNQVVLIVAEAEHIDAALLAAGVYTIKNQAGQVFRLIKK